MISRNQFLRIACGLASFASTFGVAYAAESCGRTLTLLKSGFETGEQSNYAAIPPDNTPLTLAIDYPPDGLITASPNVQVFGSLTGPANMGVMVNGRLAINNASKFTNQVISLVSGANMVTVTATTQDGATQTLTRTVNYNPAAQESVRLTAVTAGDFAPQRIPFQLRTALPPGQTLISRTQLDLDGNGNFEVDTVSPPSSIASDYAVPGVFLARARVTFDDGNVMTPPVESDSTFQIQMHQLAYTREVLCTVYYGMKHRLQANNIASALNTIVSSKRPQYQAMWASAGGNLPTIAAGLGDIVQGRIADVSAELVAAVPDVANPGDYLGYQVLLARDSTGVWRIAGM